MIKILPFFFLFFFSNYVFAQQLSIANQTVVVGSSATFFADFSGTFMCPAGGMVDTSYSWSELRLSENAWYSLSGVSRTQTIQNTTVRDSGMKIKCIATVYDKYQNKCGSVEAVGTLIVNNPITSTIISEPIPTTCIFKVNPNMVIDYTVLHPTNISMCIYDLRGNLLISAVNNFHASGKYSLKLNSKNVPPGYKLIVLKSGDQIKSLPFVFK